MTESAEYLGDPEEAFSVLGDEIRLAVLLELAEVANEEGTETGLAFSELRRRVGVEDSGRFNYHLDRLREGFIEKAGEEYILRYPGTAIVSAVYAGTYDKPLEERTAESRFDCPACDRVLEISYGDDQLAFRCPEHGLVLGYPVPPGAASGRSLQELAAVTIDRMLSELYLTLRGTCPRCWGIIDIEYPGTNPEGVGESMVFGEVACRRCWLSYEFMLRALVAAHPVVLGFYADHGLGPAESLLGTQATGYDTVGAVEVHESGATVTVELDAERLVLELDDDTPLVANHRREQ